MAHLDLVIVVRKGNQQAVNTTAGGEPTNDRPVIVQQTDNAIRIGAQQAPFVVQMVGFRAAQ